MVYQHGNKMFNRHPGFFRCSRPLGVLPIVLGLLPMTLSGCEDPLRISVPSQTEPAFALGNEARRQYDWRTEGGQFSVRKPSMFAFPEEARSQAAEWDAQRSTSLASTPIQQPPGMSDKTFQYLMRAADADIKPQHKCTIPRTAISHPGNMAFNSAGDRLLTCDGAKLGWWNALNGELLNEVSLSISNVSAICLAPDQQHVFLTADKQIQYVELESGRVIAETSSLAEPIVQWQIARDVPVVVAKSAAGTVYVFDDKLEEIEPLIPQKAEGTVSINVDATRVAFWSDNTPVEFELKELRAIRKDSPMNATVSDGTIAVCGARFTRWFTDSMIHEWSQKQQGRELSDRYWQDIELFWTPVNAWSESRDDSDDQLLIHAIRYTQEGTPQHVLCDVAPDRVLTSIPSVLEGDVIGICINENGETFLTLREDRADVYQRIRWQYQSIYSFLNAVRIHFLFEDLNELDKLGEAILAEERWGRYNLDSQEVFYKFVRTIGVEWYNTSKRPEFADRMKLADEWLSQRGMVARLAMAMRHQLQSSSYRGTSVAAAVTEEAWKNFAHEVNQGVSILTSILDEESKPPLAAFTLMISSYRTTERSHEENEAILRRCTQIYPGAVSPHQELLIWLLPRWGGGMGEIGAYASAIADLHEPEYADYLYSMLIVDFLQGFGTDLRIEVEAGLQKNRAAKGLMASLRLPGIDQVYMEYGYQYLKNELTAKQRDEFLGRYAENFLFIRNGPGCPELVTALRQYSFDRRKK